MVDKAYLTLKRAAAELGVHEQTLRSWEKRGLIRMVRLPGSGYRRVPVTEIARLRREMADARKPVMKEASAVYGVAARLAASPVEAANACRVGDVTLEPPRTDVISLQRADRMAATVRDMLAEWKPEAAFDEFLAQRRGRE